MLGHHESVKLLAEKGTTMMTNGINLSNGMGKGINLRKSHHKNFT
jgi:hypothetical protein